MGAIKVSVIIPVYNAQAHLAHTLDALLAQSLEQIELIAVDDGSKDDSGKILDQYAKDNSHLHIIHQPNGGEWQARESGIRMAVGEYIAFCDSDDLPLPECYEKMYEAAKKNESDMVVCTYIREERETGKVLSHEMLSLAGRTIDLQKDPTVYSSINTAAWNKMFRAELLQNRLVLKAPPRMMGDIFLMASLLPFVKRVTIIPDMLYRYMVRKDSLIFSLTSNDMPPLEKNMIEVRHYVQQATERDVILPTLDAMAFIFFGISIVLRRVQNGEKTSMVLREARILLEKHFPLYKKPHYGIIWNMRNDGIMFKPLVVLSCFRLKLMHPLLSIYRFITEKLHHEIKW